MKVYVCGPYTPLDGKEETRQANIRRAAAAAGKLAAAGYSPYCPHSHTIGWEDACDYAGMLSICLDWLAVCDVVVLLSGWQESPGALREHAEAVSLGMPIYERVEDLIAVGAENG